MLSWVGINCGRGLQAVPRILYSPYLKLLQFTGGWLEGTSAQSFTIVRRFALAVTDPTREAMRALVVTQERLVQGAAAAAMVKKTHLYNRLHDGHRLVPLAIEMYGAMGERFDSFLQIAPIISNREMGCH